MHDGMAGDDGGKGSTEACAEVPSMTTGRELAPGLSCVCSLDEEAASL
jgi:hypothetical protein